MRAEPAFCLYIGLENLVLRISCDLLIPSLFQRLSERSESLKSVSLQKFLVGALRLGGRLDAEFLLKKFPQSLVLLAHGDAVPLRGVRAHHRAVNVLAERVFAKDALRDGERARPLLRFLRRLREDFEKPEVLFAIVRTLLLGPLVVRPLHELAEVERRRLLVCLDEGFGVARAPRGVPFSDEPVELFGINLVRELRVELIVAVAVEQEILFQRLVAVERLPYVRDGRVKILLDRAEV